VLNTHFDHESEKARIKSTRLITESLETLSESAPVVVMGDINALPDSRPYSLFTRASDDAPPVLLRDAKRVAKQAHYGPTSTYTHFEPTVRPGQRYDYIFVGPGITVRRHGHLSARWNGQHPSNHLPVLAELRIPR